jgi:hypothetical protein
MTTTERQPQPPPSIPGADELAAWFGHWPSFHDAEVVELRLRRRGISELVLHTWAMGPVDDTGHFNRGNECVVRFSMEQLLDLNLADVSSQNVISGLSMSHDSGGWCIQLGPCYGMAGELRCQSVSVSFDPGPPRGE